MEQKRTLWTIAAVGVFLLVILGAALILYSPSKQQPQTASLDPVSKTISDGWINQPAENNTENILPSPTKATSETNPSVQASPSSEESQQPADTQEELNETTSTPLKTDSMTVISGTTNVYGVSKNSSKTTKKTSQDTNNTTTIDLNTLKAETNISQNKKTKTTETLSNKTEPNTVQNTHLNNQNEVKKTTKKTVSYTATQPVKKTVATKKIVTKPKPVVKKSSVSTASYWVQAASFTMKSSADAARAKLDENKIPSEIFTFTDNKGTLYYRVRVGPYTTKSEASYWQNRIIQIKEFSKSSSYITNSAASKKKHK